jgi:subtilisin
MKLYLFVLILLFTVVNLSSCDNDDPEEEDPCVGPSSVNGAIVIDRYIVSVPPEDESNGGRKRIKGVNLLKRNNLSEERIINHFQGKNSTYILQLTAEEAAKLKNDNEVLKIEQDKSVSICGCTFEVVEPRLVTWNADKVGYGDGRGKTAWILDSGVDLDHPDLNVDKDRSRSFHPDFSTAEDGQGHGTHTAGIIGALNNDIGTLGVASGATIVALKVLDDDGNGTVSYILDALAYIKEKGKAGDVVNMSLSVDADISTILDEEIQALANRGFYVAIAAGNDSILASELSPARANGKNIYTVSAVDSLDRFASWSNYGNDAVDFAAPGVRVLSSYMQGKYAIISGTSQAAPHVAGILLINEGKVNSQGTALNDPDGVPDPLAHK